jgi:hypothetical protein
VITATKKKKKAKGNTEPEREKDVARTALGRTGTVIHH